MSGKLPDENEFGKASGMRKIYPWVNVKPDCKKHSAGDWYRILLSASLGKDILHGVNTAPSMEVLGKVPYNPDENAAIGLLQWDPRTKRQDLLGGRVSDKFYRHHHYRGGRTKQGALVAFDEGSWEPSLKGRARASSLLAAGIAAHGLTKTDALATVSAITSDEVDPEAVDSTLLTASHLKREMTTVAKPNHRVFSQGTIQMAVLWDDRRLVLNHPSRNIAFDWGRITAIARYIGEANAQICGRFRASATGTGIPFHISRNAWAEVSSEDYQLHPALFSEVPRIDLAKVGVPSIKGAFMNHETEVFVTLTRYLRNEPANPTSDAFRGFVHHAKIVTDQFHNKRLVHITNAAEYTEGEPSKYVEDPIDLQKATKHIVSPYDLLTTAVATRAKNDNLFKTTINSFMNSTDETTAQVLDKVAELVYGQATWIIAAAGAKARIDSELDEKERTEAHQLLVVQLGKYKSDLFGFRTHVEAPVTFTEELMKRLRRSVRGLIAQSQKANTISHFTTADLVMPAVREVSTKVTYLDPDGTILAALRAGAAKEYKKLSEVASTESTPKAKQMTANYVMTYMAIKKLGVHMCMARDSGYIDGSVPKESYIYRAAKKLNQKYQYGNPKLNQLNYPNASVMAEDLDLASILQYSTKEAISYVQVTLDQVVGAMALGKIYKVPQSLMDETLDNLVGSESPGYDTLEMEEDELEESLADFMADCTAAAVKQMMTPYQIALKTYPNPDLAEKYAKYNGYKDFKSAVVDLGLEAEYSEENDFCLVAMAKVAEEEPIQEEPSPKKARGYEPMH